jgi:hypothetical protein
MPRRSNSRLDRFKIVRRNRLVEFGEPKRTRDDTDGMNETQQMEVRWPRLQGGAP